MTHHKRAKVALKKGSKYPGYMATKWQRWDDIHLVVTRYQLRDEFEKHYPDAVTFDRMRSPFYVGERWAVRRRGSCLAKDGEWELDPIPSSRDDGFYARCRFDSLDDAIAAWVAHSHYQPDPHP